MSSDELARRLADVRERIARRSPHPDRVRLIGVTKGFGPDAAASLVAAGVVDLGENYAQELLAKAPEVSGAVWHFLGPVQRNKIPKLAANVRWWHGVDRIEVGAAIADRAPGADVLVQVNASESSGRPGVAWGDAAALVDGLRQLDLSVRGLMAVASAGDPGRAAGEMDRLARLASELGLVELSMGMSDDLDIALERGATMVRIGRALLGPRPQSPRHKE